MRPSVDIPEWFAENYARLTEAQRVHVAGAAYWGSLAAWNLKMAIRTGSDIRAAKAEALACLAARHAHAAMGEGDEDCRTRIPGDGSA